MAKSRTTAGKYAFCSFYCARCIMILSGNEPSWTLPKIIQISINSDLFVFDKFTPFFPSIIVPQSGFFFLKGQMKGPLFPWESRQRRRGMVSDWFMSHTLLRCYAWIIDCRSGVATVGSWWRCRNVTFTDVTAAQILKRLCPSKAPIWARPSPTASSDTAVCQRAIPAGQISHLQPYLHKTVATAPSRSALNISNHRSVSLSPFLQWKSKVGENIWIIKK